MIDYEFGDRTYVQGVVAIYTHTHMHSHTNMHTHQNFLSFSLNAILYFNSNEMSYYYIRDMFLF